MEKLKFYYLIGCIVGAVILTVFAFFKWKSKSKKKEPLITRAEQQNIDSANIAMKIWRSQSPRELQSCYSLIIAFQFKYYKDISGQLDVTDLINSYNDKEWELKKVVLIGPSVNDNMG